MRKEDLDKLIETMSELAKFIVLMAEKQENKIDHAKCIMMVLKALRHIRDGEMYEHKFVPTKLVLDANDIDNHLNQLDQYVQKLSEYTNRI